MMVNNDYSMLLHYYVKLSAKSCTLEQIKLISVL